jgi:hypothetical protein
VIRIRAIMTERLRARSRAGAGRAGPAESVATVHRSSHNRANLVESPQNTLRNQHLELVCKAEQHRYTLDHPVNTARDLEYVAESRKEHC